MPAPVLQFKRGNAGVAGTVPALRPGEPAISLNNFDFFIGIDTSVANNKFFGSHRYWGREDGTTSLKVKLVDKDGTNSINLKSPNTLAGITTYTLPATPTNGFVLTTNADGDLSWTNSLPAASFSGITTFTNTTDNTLGNADTGAVQIDGGLGINKNLTVGQNLHVQGYSNFVGVVTFQGGTINLGDDTGDNINIGGEFTSGLYPNTTNTYDFGDSTRQWRNASFAGVGTFSTGAVIDNIRIGISDANTIDTTAGKLTLNSATNTVEIAQHLDVIGDLDVTGNVYIGGTTVTLRGTDVFIENKDIVLGYTTTTQPNDTTANHAGVAIASTEGTPLANFNVSGINTLPSTYKQMMWFKSGTLGFSTDAFGFNYGVAIGTTNMANGIRLAVGSGITMTDTEISATTFRGAFTGNVTGNASSADQVKTVTASDLNSTHYLTFVNSHNGSATNESIYTDDAIYYNPGTNTFTTQHALFTGNVNISGITTLAGNITLGDAAGDAITINGTATFTQGLTGTISTATRATLVDTTTAPSGTFYPGLFVSSTGTASTAVYVDAGISYVSNTDTLTLTGDIAVNGGDVTTSASTFNLVNGTATNINFGGAATALNMGAATGIGTIRNATVSFPNATTVAVNGVNPTISGTSTGTLTLFNTNLTAVNAFGAATSILLGASSGITTVRNSLRVTNSLYDSTNSAGINGQFLVVTGAGIGWTTISGVSAGTISTAARSNTVDTTTTTTNQNYYIPFVSNGSGTNGETVRVGAALSINPSTNTLTVPTIQSSAVKALDGTAAITITNSTGALQTNSDLTVGGNLYINGSTTQVNTAAITVEDRTIELGVVDGSAPSSTTTWDLGVLFNYNDGSAKKSALVWEQGDARFKLGSVISDGGGTGNSNPQITFTTYAPLEIGSLWVNDCAGQSQVINCSGTTRKLENITIDGGTW
jgi:hypothetical protein